jgi:hypothetical protein
MSAQPPLKKREKKDVASMTYSVHLFLAGCIYQPVATNSMARLNAVSFVCHAVGPVVWVQADKKSSEEDERA